MEQPKNNETNKSAGTTNDKYSDIINRKYRGVISHPRMTLENRAAQFAPFAAV